MTFKRALFMSLVFLLVTACNDEKKPEDVLRSFVNYRFSSGQDRDKILNFTSGILFQKIASMSDEEFAKFQDTSKYKKKRFKIKLKKCSPEQCFLTYIVSYDKLKGDKKTFSIEIKKIAEMEKRDSGWKISDVSNVKTFYDSVDAIEP